MHNLKPMIIISAYGSGDPEAQRYLELLDEKLHDRFSNHEIRWAITADWLIKRFRNAGKTTLFARGEPIRSLAELYQELSESGKTGAVVQCLLIHEGVESDLVYATPTSGLQVEYGPSLLEGGRNVDTLLEVVSGYFGSDKDLTILIGHGSDTDKRSNVPFLRMDEQLRSKRPNTYVCMIHGSPSPDEVLPRIETSQFKRVVFVPLMMTAGEHIKHEVIADKPESWICRLGLPYHLAPSLSETPRVMEIYFKSIEDALQRLQDKQN